MKKDIAILYNNEADQRTYKGFNNKIYTNTLTGIQALLQKITKLLLTPIGTDLYNKNIGTTITSLLSNTSISGVETKILEIVGDLEEFIRRDQATDLNLEDSERLISLEVSDVVTRAGGTEILINILVNTADKNTYFIRI